MLPEDGRPVGEAELPLRGNQAGLHPLSLTTSIWREAGGDAQTHRLGARQRRKSEPGPRIQDARARPFAASNRLVYGAAMPDDLP